MNSLTSPRPRRLRLAFTALACSLLAACASSPVTAPPSPAPEPPSAPVAQTANDDASLPQAFAAWIASFGATARTAGISEETLRAAFSEVRYVPRVVELDRVQPEFTRTVWDYLDRTVTPQRIATGRTQLAQVRGEADAAATRYGVPADIVVAIRSGWQAGRPWGVEVRLPPGFDAGRADDSVRQPAGQWAAEGVQAIGGASLPDLADAMILLPAGASGPAFMVGANFRAILRYNNPTSYALAVGLLAQGLAGDPGVQAPWPRHLQALDRGQMLALQIALNESGFASGTPDGLMGPAIRGALRRFQRGLGLAADG